MEMNTEDVVTAVGDMSPEDLDLVQSMINLRRKLLREVKSAANQAEFGPGTRVVLTGIRPKYLNGLYGEVVRPSTRRAGDLEILIDEGDRLGAERYLSPAGTINVPAGALAKARRTEV
jgi:hypothetical protein